MTEEHKIIEQEDDEEFRRMMFEFADGKVFEAYPNPDDTASIVIKENDKVIFNFADLLPEGYIFVTKAYVGKYEEREADFPLWHPWTAHRELKWIQLPRLENEGDVFAILHEMGHAKDFSTQEYLKDLAHFNQFTKQEAVRFYSDRERRAWAFALRTARLLQKQKGINIQGIYPSFEDLKNYIDSFLASHREDLEESMALDPELFESLKKLFDRRQFAGFEGEDDADD